MLLEDRFEKKASFYTPPGKAGSWLRAIIDGIADTYRSDSTEKAKDRVRLGLISVGVPLFLYLLSLLNIPILLTYIVVFYLVYSFYGMNSRLVHRNSVYVGFYYSSLVFYAGTVATYLVPEMYELGGVLLVIIFWGLFGATLYSFHNIVTRDPEFLPKASLEEDKQNIRRLALEGKLTDLNYCYSCGVCSSRGHCSWQPLIPSLVI